MAAWLTAELSVVGSLERAHRLRTLCPVSGATDEDYLARVVELPGGARSLLQIRFKGGDAKRPFVQWVASDAPIHGSTELVSLAAQAMDSFAALRPFSMRIWIPSGAPWEPAGAHPGCTRGDRWLAAPVQSMSDPGTVRVVAISADEIFPRYESEYRAYLASHPQAEEWIRAESAESLRNCQEQGGLFALREGDAVRGLVALRRQSGPWFTGWHVVESLIFDGSRGRGLAAPMHQAAYVQLESAPGDVIWGTIDPRNGASLATALAVGRVDIGGDWWIDGKNVT